MRIKIQAIDNRGKVFEGSCDLRPVDTSSERPLNVSSSSKPYKKPKPSSAVELLFRDNFFKSARGLSDVVKTVSDQLGFNFGSTSLLMAMKASPYLLRKGSKGHYRFIQRYPPE